MKNILVIFVIFAIGVLSWNIISGFDEQKMIKAADHLLQILERQERDLTEYKKQKKNAEDSFLHIKESIISAMIKHPLVLMLRESFREIKIDKMDARECENLYRDKFDLLTAKYEKSVRDSVHTTFKIMNKNAKEMLMTITRIKLNLQYELTNEIYDCRCECPSCRITGEYVDQVTTVSQMLDQFKNMTDVVLGESKRLVNEVFSNPYSPPIWKDLVLPVFSCFQEHDL